MEQGIGWVRLQKYLDLSGDTADAVHGRRRLGKWKDGVHCKVVNRKLWINLKNVEQWVENAKR